MVLPSPRSEALQKLPRAFRLPEVRFDLEIEQVRKVCFGSTPKDEGRGRRENESYAVGREAGSKEAQHGRGERLETVKKSWMEHLPPPGRFLWIVFIGWFPPKDFPTKLMYGIVCSHLFQIGAGLGRLPDWTELKGALSSTAFLGVCWIVGCGTGVCQAAYRESLK